MFCSPITSCESERSFSQLKLMKTSRHSTMSAQRLSGLALMKINWEWCQQLHDSPEKLGQLVGVFAQANPRRMPGTSIRVVWLNLELHRLYTYLHYMSTLIIIIGVWLCSCAVLEQFYGTKHWAPTSWTKRCPRMHLRASIFPKFSWGGACHQTQAVQDYGGPSCA